MTEQNQPFLKDLRRVGSRPLLPKHAKIGLILLVLWDFGLKRLTYNQIRGFLKTVGLSQVPPHAALARYGERLALRKYHIDPPRAEHEDQ